MSRSIFAKRYFVTNAVVDGYVAQEGTVNRVYAQYKNSPKLIKWLGIVPNLLNPLISGCSQVSSMLDVDTAQGEQLNIIGRIVVISRTYEGNVALNVAQFNSDGDFQFGDDTAVFSALNADQDQNLSDDLYRLLIKSKIAKNNSDATIEGILNAFNSIFTGTEATELIDNEDMTFSISISGTLTELEKYVVENVDILPRPQGVKFKGIV